MLNWLKHINFDIKMKKEYCYANPEQTVYDKGRRINVLVRISGLRDIVSKSFDGYGNLGNGSLQSNLVLEKALALLSQGGDLNRLRQTTDLFRFEEIFDVLKKANYIEVRN